MKRLVKWGCSFLSCVLCCFCVAGVGGTLGSAARRHHQVGRIVYVALFVAGTFTAWALYNLPVWIDSASYLSVLPNFRGCNITAQTGDTESLSLAAWLLQHELGTTALAVPERLCFGALSVHRVLLGLSMFHIILALAMIGASGDRQSSRYAAQHGWWMLKLVLLGVLELTAFLVLDDSFISIYSWFAFAGALAFSIVEIMLLVEFAYRTSQAIAGATRKAQGESGRCGAVAGGLIVIILAYVLTFTFIGLAYASVPAPACAAVWITSTVTLVLVLLISFGAFLAQRTARGGIMPASIVCAYGAYLTWSAFSPLALADMNCLDVHQALSAIDGSETAVARVVHFATLRELSRDAQDLILLGATVIALAYTAFRTSSATAEQAAAEETEGDTGENDGVLRPTSVPSEDASEADAEAGDAATVGDGTEAPPAPYSFSWFHVMLALACAYAAMVLTGWNQLHAKQSGESETVFVNQTATSAYVNLAMAWLTMLCYLWTLFVPFVRARCARRREEEAHVTL
jgi:hypothetical protein